MPAPGGPLPFPGDSGRELSCPIPHSMPTCRDSWITRVAQIVRCRDLHHQRELNSHTRDCDAIVRRRRPSGNRRARVSRNFGGSIKFSVTFIALPYDLLNRGAGMTETAGISGDRIRSFIERVEHIDDEIKALNEGKKEVFAEAREGLRCESPQGDLAPSQAGQGRARRTGVLARPVSQSHGEHRVFTSKGGVAKPRRTFGCSHCTRRVCGRLALQGH